MSRPHTNEELADWLLSRKNRFVPGSTGYDWDDRFTIDLIVERLRAQRSDDASRTEKP